MSESDVAATIFQHPDPVDEGWVEHVNERPHLPVFGSAVVRAHVERLIETGTPLDPDGCARCAQLVVSLRRNDGV